MRHFSPAKRAIDDLRQILPKEAGVMFIQGLIENGYGAYESEREKYDEAIQSNEQLAYAYWYKGQSFSWQVYDEIDKPMDIKYDGLEKIDSKYKKYVDCAIKSLRQARQRRPQCAWMAYDYACELIRWNRNENELNVGLDNLVIAADFEGTRKAIFERIATEPYLDEVRAHPRFPKA